MISQNTQLIIPRSSHPQEFQRKAVIKNLRFTGEHFRQSLLLRFTRVQQKNLHLLGYLSHRKSICITFVLSFIVVLRMRRRQRTRRNRSQYRSSRSRQDRSQSRRNASVVVSEISKFLVTICIFGLLAQVTLVKQIQSTAKVIHFKR